MEQCQVTGINNRTLVIFGILSVWFSGIINGQEDYPITDRSPAYATSFTMPARTIMVESGFFNVSDLQGLGKSNLNGFNIQTRVGIANRTELRATTGFIHLHPEEQISLPNTDLNGMNSLHIGLKTQINEETSVIPGLSLLMNMEFSSPGNDFFTPSNLSPSFRLIAEKFINKTFIFGTNLGFLWRSQEAEYFTYAISLRTALTEHISIYSELYGNNSSLTPTSNYLDWAIEFWIIDDMVLDIAFGVGISENTDKSFLSIGGGWRID